MKEHRLGNLKKFKENQSLNNISNNDNDIQVKQTNSNLQSNLIIIYIVIYIR